MEAIRLLRLERRSAIKARTQAANQLHGAIATAPETVRQRLGGRTIRMIVKVAAAFRVPEPVESLDSTMRYVLRGLAQRWPAPSWSLWKTIRNASRARRLSLHCAAFPRWTRHRASSAVID